MYVCMYVRAGRQTGLSFPVPDTGSIRLTNLPLREESRLFSEYPTLNMD
jgi:hypothetical protein